MANEEKNRDAREGSESSDASECDLRRRQALKVGAVLVPTIITLRATPAWAQTDYTLVAYRYGNNAGLCRNPMFNPNSDPGTFEAQEFVQCPIKAKDQVGGSGLSELGD